MKYRRFFYYPDTAVADAPADAGPSLAEQWAQQDAPKEQAPTPDPSPVAPVVPEPTKPEPKKGAASLVPDAIFDTPTPEVKPEPKPDVKPEELNADELTKGMSDKGRANFKRLEESYKGRLQAMAVEMETLKKAPIATPEQQQELETLRKSVQELQSERDELSKTVELLGVERSPKFQQQFIQGRNKLVEDAARKVQNAGGDPVKFREALQLDGREKYRAMEEAMGDAPGFVQNQIAATVTEIERLDEQRDQALQDARGTLGKWGEEQTAAQRKEHEKTMQARAQRFDEMLPEAQKEVLLLRRIPADNPSADSWNKMVDEVVNGGKDFLFNGGDFDQFAVSALKARAYGPMQEMFLKTREENIALHKQIQELTASEPGGGAGGGTGPKASDANQGGLAEQYMRLQTQSGQA